MTARCGCGGCEHLRAPSVASLPHVPHAAVTLGCLNGAQGISLADPLCDPLPQRVAEWAHGGWRTGEYPLARLSLVFSPVGRWW